MYAQDISSFEVLLAKVEHKYNNQDRYRYKIAYTYFDENSDDTPSEIVQGISFKDSERIYVRLNDTETLNTKDHYIKINHLEKAVVYAGLTNRGSEAPPINLVAFKGLKDKMLLVHTCDSLATYKIEFPSSPFVKYRSLSLTIDRINFEILKQEFVLSEIDNNNSSGGRIIIDIIPDNLDFNEDIPNISDYLNIDGGVKLSQKLKDYEFYNSSK